MAAAPRAKPDEFDLLADEYLRECQSTIDSLEADVISLTQPAQQLGILNSMARTIHSIKGAAGSYGFDVMSSICHNFEDRLTAIQLSGGDIEGQIDGLLRYVDLLKAAARAYALKRDSEIEKIRSQIGGHFLKIVDRGAIAHRRKRVLVIEKTRWFSGAINRHLSTYGESEIEVASARDGYEGLGRLLKENFDCVIMSNMADWISGIELMKFISTSSTRNQKTPFVLLTSSDLKVQSGQEKRICVVEKDDHLDKNLKKVIESILGAPTPETDGVKIPFSRILLIDDSSDMHRLVTLAFKKYAEVTIEVASSGQEGLDKVSKFRPDLILLDYMMPAMSGEDVAKGLMASVPETPFVFLTGLRDETEKNHLLSLGAKAVFKKPFPPKDLPLWVASLKSTGK